MEFQDENSCTDAFVAVSVRLCASEYGGNHIWGFLVKALEKVENDDFTVEVESSRTFAQFAQAVDERARNLHEFLHR